MTRLIKRFQKQYKTDFLFVNPCFAMGLGSILNIGGNFFPINYSESSAEADFKAIHSDWGMVGRDIDFAIDVFRTELPQVKSLTNGW
jgi:hypothetical protein